MARPAPHDDFCYGWLIGSSFRFIMNRDGTRGRFSHRVYRDPPCCRSRRITAAELYVDFTTVYRIQELHISEKWLAVRFYPGHGDRMVWSNVRKWNSMWAAVEPFSRSVQ